MSLTPSISLDNNIHILQEDIELACCIIIGKNYISYCISDTEFKTVYHLKHFATAEGGVIGKNDFESILQDKLIKKSKKITIALDSFKSILVPFALVPEKNQAEYFTYFHEIGNDETILKQSFNDSVTDLFVVKKSTLQFLKARFANVKIVNANACVLNTYPEQLIVENTYHLFISVKQEHCILTLYNKHDLQLHQTYAFQHENDILYFVANICNQFQINKEKLCIQIHGEMPQLEEVLSLLKKYYTNVKFITRIKEIQYPDTLYAHPVHYFFNLFSIFKCV